MSELLEIDKAIIYHHSKDLRENISSGPSVYCIGVERNPLLNGSCYIFTSDFNQGWKTMLTQESDREFNSLAQQLNNLLNDFDVSDTNKAMMSLSELLRMRPKKLTFEVTNESSVFYTFKKNDYTIFLNHYLTLEYDDDDEAILTVFKGDQKMPSYAGRLMDALREIREIFFPVFAQCLDKYEVSFGDSAKLYLQID